jgi:hypothetical protein
MLSKRGAFKKMAGALGPFLETLYKTHPGQRWGRYKSTISLKVKACKYIAILL